MEQPQTFSKKLQRLEEIVSQLDSTTLELEEGIKLLEEGVILHKECQTILTESQAKITTLLKIDQSEVLSPKSSSVPLDVQLDQADSTDVSINQNELPF